MKILPEFDAENSKFMTKIISYSSWRLALSKWTLFYQYDLYRYLILVEMYHRYIYFINLIFDTYLSKHHTGNVL